MFARQIITYGYNIFLNKTNLVYLALIKNELNHLITKLKVKNICVFIFTFFNIFAIYDNF